MPVFEMVVRIPAQWIARLFEMKSDGVTLQFRLKWWARRLLWLGKK